MDPNASAISLEGSTSIVVEFFEYCLNSILYQRAIYPPEDFVMSKKYGLNLFVTLDDDLKSYVQEIIQQVQTWLAHNKLSKLVLIIKSKETMETVERWQFDIQTDKSLQHSQAVVPESLGTDRMDVVEQQIRAIMRQITASISFLPELKDECTFNVLAYTDEDAIVPVSWTDSEPNLIRGGGEHVRLKSFSTPIHKINPIVAYRMDD